MPLWNGEASVSLLIISFSRSRFVAANQLLPSTLLIRTRHPNTALAQKLCDPFHLHLYSLKAMMSTVFGVLEYHCPNGCIHYIMGLWEARSPSIKRVALSFPRPYGTSCTSPQ